MLVREAIYHVGVADQGPRLAMETHGLAGPSTDFLTRDRRRIPRRRREAPPPIGKSQGARNY